VKRKIAAAKIPYRIPADHELTDRLGPVLAVVYLIFNEGYIAATSDTLVRRDLCDEAIRLARLLVQLMPDEPEAIGLLALMLLSHARTPARTDRDGEFVRLADQDRTLWDFAMIGEGHELVRQCLRRNRPGPYQYQAAINAVHTDARRADATDWAQIVVLYNQYFEADPSPIVALNRAIAIGELEGPEAGLDALDKIQRTDYAYFHAARAEFLKRAGRPTDALDAITQALSRTSNATERRHLERERRTLRAEATIQKRGANARPSQ
jgi:RNA polymerase sigma-70 factor (ECF subfamily)